MTEFSTRYDKTCARCGDKFVARHPIARYCSENCRKRACDSRHRKTCPECGAVMAVRSGWSNTRPQESCRPCYDAKETERVAARDAEIAQMWADGQTLREIANHFGWTKNHAAHEVYARMRERGTVLPYRRSPAAVANIQAGIDRAKRAA